MGLSGLGEQQEPCLGKPVIWFGVQLLCGLLKAVPSYKSQLWRANTFFLLCVLLMHLLVNACVFVAKLFFRMLFTMLCHVHAESRISGIMQGELGPVL